ncbi:uncharacterized protein LOC129735235 [Falco cherrug]|uniref:uncharacterized protein LOC129735235 n=1 Tax=Falco cherrug TaxID=345164 RepID=UPI00247A3C76|nr:uncharacterized protein LOC129735235 [Falco cherrug]
MVGHLQLQGMDESLKEKSREGLLDSPDSGLPPSPSPPFYSLSPGESRAGGSGGADPPAPGHRREAKDGKVVRTNPWALGSILTGPRGGEWLAQPGSGGQQGRGLCPLGWGTTAASPWVRTCLRWWMRVSRAVGYPIVVASAPSWLPVPDCGGQYLVVSAIRRWHCCWCAQAGGWPSAGQGFSDKLTEMLAVWLDKLLIMARE